MGEHLENRGDIKRSRNHNMNCDGDVWEMGDVFQGYRY